MLAIIVCQVLVLGGTLLINACNKTAIETIHVWETIELTFEAEKEYSNPYTEVETWIILTGPDQNKRKVWGFWDGENTFKVRLTGNKEGVWKWESHSNQNDAGLNERSGEFKTVAWSEEQKRENPNRRGFIEPTKSGHAWQYKDGTPFFMLADTWWGAPTWRYPFSGKEISENYIPDSTNFNFEGGIQWLKKLGFNSIGIITALPNWADNGGKNVYDNSNVLIRSGKTPHNNLCMTMHSDNGHRAFRFPGKSNGKTNVCPDYNRINPDYFKDLDKKMFYLNANGIVPYVETIRRDASPAWEAYYEWPNSFSRYINYIAARYGTINMIYSLVHYDIVDLSISAEKWDEAFDHWYSYYTNSEGMPFGQPTVAMAAYSTYQLFGHITENPWLQAHSVGNRPKDHTMMERLEEAMKVKPYIPGYCNEPYYVGWIENKVNGERVEMNSYRDNYFARAHAYGHMMNGGIAGHIIGTGSRWCTGPGEKYTKSYPPPWETLHYQLVKGQAAFLPEFLISEGLIYRNLTVKNEDLPFRKRDGFTPQHLEGWAHMIKTPDNKFALLYFEQEAQNQTIENLKKNTFYEASWFDPRNGEWIEINNGKVKTDENGTYKFPNFPGNEEYAQQDWAAKLVLKE